MNRRRDKDLVLRVDQRGAGHFEDKKISDIFSTRETYQFLRGSMEHHYVKEGVWEIYYDGAFWMDGCSVELDLSSKEHP